ncbi:hypothetical protein B0O99DRAFT_620566 [Bisporella sp. PMI_857]|nr:hypothetical protein B0O99DRAFT_620566 [Bisporella sp. PMI_857]
MNEHPSPRNYSLVIFSGSGGPQNLSLPSNKKSHPKDCRPLRSKEVEMARGNQRDKAREANQKKMAEQKKGNTMTGAQMAADKERVAKMMREKQAAGLSPPFSLPRGP